MTTERRTSRRPLSQPPRRVFSVGAIAIAHPRANAVGAVRLTCGPEGLAVELLRASPFAAGFAPGAIAEEVRFAVPYLAVRGLTREGRTLCLALDARVAAPHNRFVLTRFSDDPTEALVGAYRARARVRVATIAAPLPVALLVALVLPSDLVSGALGLAAVAAIAALATWAVLREVLAWASWGGPVSDRYRDALEVELSRRLGLAPTPMVALPWGTEPEPALAEPPEPARARWRTPALVAGTTATLVGAIALFNRVAEPPAPEALRPDVPVATRGLARVSRRAAVGAVRGARPALAAAEIPDEAATALGEPCLCARADSPLWPAGVPVVSVLLASRRDDGALAPAVVTPPVVPEPDAGTDDSPEQASREETDGVFRYDFDLSAVNNGARPLPDVRVVVTFARRNARGRRVGIHERGLYWGKELLPGRAVKWHVTGRGTEMRIDRPELGLVADGEIAPPDAYFELTAARQQPVRDHAATMLAYLRDPRATEAAESLIAGADSERARRGAAIERALAPVFACRVIATAERLDACLFNGSSRAQAVGSVALAPDPAATAGRRVWMVDGSIPVHEGRTLSIQRPGLAPRPGSKLDELTVLLR